MEFTRSISPKLKGLGRFTKIRDKAIRRLKDLPLILGQCDLCTSNNITQALICQHCLDDLPLFDYQLVENGLLNWPAINKLLANNQFDQLFCVAPYIWPFDHWLKQYKYQGRFELKQLFADLLATLWQQQVKSQLAADTLLLSVPLHPKKWQQRGYNQAHLVAKEFAKQVDINYQPNLLIRTRYNQGQVGQTGAERRKNLKNSFALESKAAYLPAHIVLFDDVMTTGTTINEICRLLKKQGVKTITVLTLALSLPID